MDEDTSAPNAPIQAVVGTQQNIEVSEGYQPIIERKGYQPVAGVPSSNPPQGVSAIVPVSAAVPASSTTAQAQGNQTSVPPGSASGQSATTTAPASSPPATP